MPHHIIITIIIAALFNDLTGCLKYRKMRERENQMMKTLPVAHWVKTMKEAAWKIHSTRVNYIVSAIDTTFKRFIWCSRCSSLSERTSEHNLQKRGWFSDFLLKTTTTHKKPCFMFSLINVNFLHVSSMQMSQNKPLIYNIKLWRPVFIAFLFRWVSQHKL